MSASDLLRIVVLTGAGVSAESGLKTFRASDGLWEDHRIEDVATPEGFQKDRELVHRFYNQRRRQLQDQAVQPNPAHKALAELGVSEGVHLTLVTQNIDNLHERAGSENLYHMHGELLQVLCFSCGEVSVFEDDVTGTSRCPACGALGCLRPNIVWFGEMPFFMDEIYAALTKCDVFAAIGTSGQVYPAAGFVEVAHQAGAKTWELNLEATHQVSLFHNQSNGPASEVVPDWVRQIIDAR